MQCAARSSGRVILNEPRYDLASPVRELAITTASRMVNGTVFNQCNVVEYRRILMAELVRLTRQGDVAVITIDNPPVNAISPGVPEGIDAAIKQADADEQAQAIVIIGAGSTFIAGADIREFGKIISG